MKPKFKVGDLVRHKEYPELGMGKITEIFLEGGWLVEVRIEWQWHNRPEGWYPEEGFELAETPIQRMKRLYNEKV